MPTLSNGLPDNRAENQRKARAWYFTPAVPETATLALGSGDAAAAAAAARVHTAVVGLTPVTARARVEFPDSALGGVACPARSFRLIRRVPPNATGATDDDIPQLSERAPIIVNWNDGAWVCLP
jgi:hypothetical protein